MRSSKILPATLVLTTLFSLTVSASLMKDIFENTNWKVNLEPAAGESGKAFKDVLTFKGNKFSAESLVKLGYEAGAYEDNSRGGMLATFTAKSDNPKGGKTEWEGTVTAYAIKGTLKWTKPDGTVQNFTFEGEKN